MKRQYSPRKKDRKRSVETTQTENTCSEVATQTVEREGKQTRSISTQTILSVACNCCILEKRRSLANVIEFLHAKNCEK